MDRGSTRSTYAAIPARTWMEGQARAAELGASLVTVDDASEQAWLVKKFGRHETFWIGLTDADTEGQWRWADGEPVSYTNWAVDEPNNLGGESFGVMNWRAPGAWNDMSAASARQATVRRAIVERPAAKARGPGCGVGMAVDAASLPGKGG